MYLVAKVRFPSPLPQLDKEFDYLVDEEIVDKVLLGYAVQVPFGPGGKLKLGFVSSLAQESSFSSKLLKIEKLVSSFPVITKQQLELCEAVAKRQAGTIGELLGTAVPKASVRASKAFEREDVSADTQRISVQLSSVSKTLKEHNRVFFSAELLAPSKDSNHWAYQFALLSAEQVKAGKSALVVLPDFTDLETFEMALNSLGLENRAIRHSSSDSGTTRYGNHLRAIRDVAINYGLRGACFAPARNLGVIILWNDGDDSHTEQSAPYWNSREVLLQRAELENSQIVISSYSPSAEVIRLIEIGFLYHLEQTPSTQLALVSSSNERLDFQSYSIIANALKVGKSVLVQIANAGWATSVACVGCKEIRTCPFCNCSIWIDPAGKFRCRNCRATEPLPPCSCGKIGTRPTRLGASAIASQLSKSFPGATVLNSNGENRLTNVQGEGILVVATPGAEPKSSTCYACVLIADAASMIGAPRLRALEQSLGKWAGAISLAGKDSTIIFVGLRENLASQMKRLDFFNAVRDDYLDRIELGLPPSTRLASISASNKQDFELFCQKLDLEFDSNQIRRLPTELNNVLVIDYPYSLGAQMAEVIRRLTTEITLESKSKKPGERVFRLNMDDSKVI